MRNVIAAILQNDRAFCVESHRTLNAKSLAEELLNKAVKSEENRYIRPTCKGTNEEAGSCLHGEQEFAAALYNVEEMWPAFHKIRIETFRLMM